MFCRISDGYDGQFYYRLALEPFTDRQMKYGVAMDDPRYRQQRILYPLVVHLLSFGNHQMVPSLMVLVNFISIAVMGYLGGLYAQQYNRHALFGLVFPIYAGFFLSLSRDLAEVLEVTFVLAALLCLSKRRHLLAAILISLAILSKETALLIAVGRCGSIHLQPVRKPTEMVRIHGPHRGISRLAGLAERPLGSIRGGRCPQ